MINYEIFRNFANVIEKSMKKVKQILSRIYHIPALKYVVVTLIGIILIGFVDENSVWHHMVNKQRISELQEEIDAYTQQNKNDQAQIQKLDSDPKAIKKIARERYFMKADNEDIFVLSDDPQTGKSILNDDETAE
jgi:cell division protein FtsB